ncbi:hypothetical protein E4L96_20130 [Massilia arenosa]|uniref:Uncharacterized protein n=1 Tax=Zemynaea arenosa TaxID=2561931 RepID=A0A4Y9RVT5_9BURK|nr:hypothetical protein [Massilia arenosa]TFW13407.1 hypothetical protein E4L96_20130 [Massilia arenosa]
MPVPDGLLGFNVEARTAVTQRRMRVQVLDEIRCDRWIGHLAVKTTPGAILFEVHSRATGSRTRIATFFSTIVGHDVLLQSKKSKGTPVRPWGNIDRSLKGWMEWSCSCCEQDLEGQTRTVFASEAGHLTTG